MSRVSREVIWVALGQAVAAAGSIVGVRLLTEALSPSEYGELALGLTAVSLSQQLVMGPISGAALRFFAPATESRQLPSYLRGVLKLLIRGTAITVAVGISVCLALWFLGRRPWIAVGIGALEFSLLSGYSSVLDGVQNAARQRIIVAWHNGIAPWLRFALAVAMTHLILPSSAVAMLGYAIAAGIVLVSQVGFFRQYVVKRLVVTESDGDGDWSRRMTAYASPFVAWGLFTWAQLSSDRWALQIFGSSRDVGLYAVLYQLGYYPVTLLAGLMMQSITPILFGRAGDASDPVRMERVRHITLQLILATLLLTLFGTLAAGLLKAPIFKLFAAPEYASVAWLLPWMVLSGGIFAAGQVAALSLLSEIKASRLMPPKIATALIGVGLNLAGAKVAGVQGVVCANLAFSCLYTIWVFFLARPMRSSSLFHNSRSQPSA